MGRAGARRSSCEGVKTSLAWLSWNVMANMRCREEGEYSDCSFAEDHLQAGDLRNSVGAVSKTKFSNTIQVLTSNDIEKLNVENMSPRRDALACMNDQFVQEVQVTLIGGNSSHCYAIGCFVANLNFYILKFHSTCVHFDQLGPPFSCYHIFCLSVASCVIAPNHRLSLSHSQHYLYHTPTLASPSPLPFPADSTSCLKEADRLF